MSQTQPDPVTSRFFAAMRPGTTLVLFVGHVSGYQADALLAQPDHAEITEAQYQAISSSENLFDITKGVLTQRAPPPPDMADVIKEAHAKLDARAETLRLAVLTGGSTMQTVYASKLRDADAVHAVLAAGGTPVASDYIMLAGEIGLTAPTLVAVAKLVLARSRQIDTWLVQSERIRLRAKRAIRLAARSEEVDTALAAVVWPTPP